MPLISSTSFDDMAQVSPDGRWIAYRSNNRFVGGVRATPVARREDPAGRWQISTQGGGEPSWRRDGKELFYVSYPGLALMAVSVKADGGALVFGTPKALFKAPIFPDARRNRYVPSHWAGSSLLVLLRPDEDSAFPIQVLLNWQSGVLWK